MRSSGTRTKSLHTEVVYYAVLFYRLDSFLYLLSIFRSQQSQHKSKLVTLQTSYSDGILLTLNYPINPDFSVSVCLFEESLKLMCFCIVQADHLCGDTPFVL